MFKVLSLLCLQFYLYIHICVYIIQIKMIVHVSFSKKKTELDSGEMAQSVKYLLCKYRGMRN